MAVPVACVGIRIPVKMIRSASGQTPIQQNPASGHLQKSVRGKIREVKDKSCSSIFTKMFA